MAVVRNLMVRAGADFSKMRTEMQRAQKDLAKFKSSINKTMSLVAAGLAALGIGKGFKDAVAAINHTIEQETKLATVMRKTMGATDDVIRSLFSLADAQEAVGVVSADAQKAGAAELSTYLTQAKSLKLLIPALNDLTAAQYGFTASAEQVVGLSTMLGKVMDGQVGALSRYGFTFDKAQEQILKYGSEAQRAALLVEIISDSVGGMNEALRQTPQGQMLALKNTLGSVKSEIGKGLLPIIAKVMPYLQAMANWFLKAAQAVSAFTSALFGKVETGGMGKGVAVQTDGVEELGDAYDEAGKKAKKAQKSTAGFDQLNTIGQNSGSDKDDKSVGGGGGGFDLGGFDTGGIAEEMSTVAQKAQEMAARVKDAFSKMKEVIVSNKDIIIAALTGLAVAFAGLWLAANWGKMVAAVQAAGKAIAIVLAGISWPVVLIIGLIGALVGAFVYFYRTNEQFRTTVQDIFQKIKDVAQQLWKDVMVPFGQWLKTELPKAWAAVSAAAMDVWERALVPFGKWLADVLPKAWEVIATVAMWLWDSVLKPFGAWLMDVMPKAWAAVSTAAMFLWNNVLKPIGNFLLWFWKEVIVPLAKVLGDVLGVAFKVVADIAKSFWKNVLVPLGNALSEMFGPAVEAVSAVLTFLWKKVFTPLATFLTGVVKVAFEALITVITFLWKNVLKPVVEFVGGIFSSVFDSVFRTLGTIIDGLKTAFIGLMNFITGVFTGNWTKAWNGLKDIFKGVFESLWGIVKLPLNLIIDGINTVIGALNSISVDIPEFDVFGKKVGGGNIGINLKKIPKLAKGGLAYGPTLAMVGDNRGAALDPEVVSPLSKLEGMIDSGNDNRDVVSAINNLIRVVKETSGDVVLQVGQTELGRIAAKGINDIQRRTGVSPLRI